MKKINRFIAVLMIFVLALGSLSACGKKETSGDVQNSSSSGESKEGNSDSKNKKDLNSTNTSGDSSDAKDATSDGSSNGGSNDSSADTANPLAKQLQIVVLSDSKVKVSLTSEYLSQLECRDNGDGSQTSLNALYISGYDSDYNQIFFLDFTKWGWNFGAGENFWADGDMNLENDTATFEISLLDVGTVMRKVSRINMMYNDWHDNPDEPPKVLMNEDYSAEGVVTEQPMEAILRVSFPQDNRVKFTLAKTAEIETSINDSEYGGSVGIALYPDAAALNGHRSAVSIDLSCSKYEGETDYYANLSATKYTQIDEWSYNQEWIDLDEFGLRVYRIINGDSVAVTATMDDIQSLISACSVYEVYDNYYNTIEIGYLKDVFKNESYGSFPAEFADATDAEFGFVPHSDSYRLVSFETEIDIPTMEWYQEWYDGFCYGNRGSTHTGKVRVVVFWNNDETGYSNMACKLIFDNEKDKKDYLAGIYTTFVYGAPEADDSLITDELYTEAIKDAYFEDCYYVGDSGNTAYFESSSYYTESIFDDDYSHDIEVFDLDLWHGVEYAKGEQVSQNATLSIYNRATYETISRDVSLTSYSTY